MLLRTDVSRGSSHRNSEKESGKILDLMRPEELPLLNMITLKYSDSIKLTYGEILLNQRYLDYKDRRGIKQDKVTLRVTP